MERRFISMKLNKGVDSLTVSKGVTFSVPGESLRCKAVSKKEIKMGFFRRLFRYRKFKLEVEMLKGV